MFELICLISGNVSALKCLRRVRLAAEYPPGNFIAGHVSNTKCHGLILATRDFISLQYIMNFAHSRQDDDLDFQMSLPMPHTYLLLSEMIAMPGI